MKKSFGKIKLIKDGDKKPTKKDIEQYKEYVNTSVGSQGMNNKDIHTYYQLLRELQGEIEPYLSGKVSLMIDSNDFIKDSLFCEWAYIINLDTEKLEVWEGFQIEPQENRYKVDSQTNNLPDDKYFNCALLKEYDLNDLPESKQFLRDLGVDEEEIKQVA